MEVFQHAGTINTNCIPIKDFRCKALLLGYVLFLMHTVFGPVTDLLCRLLHAAAMLIVKRSRISAPSF